ncbi:MAG TPA: glycerophosphodiester phosphodiesterase [Gammaproteobacteria bacterium]|nr:glycerophosphodiester phosphodiesterase [Gammaproteobacteria bacterium]
MESIPYIAIHGHRGARGLRPENTLPAFATALSIGVDALELDIAITADQKVVIAHDRLLNPALLRRPDGQRYPDGTTRIADMTLHDLQTLDCGRLDPDSDYARDWPQQQAVDGAWIPELRELVALVHKAKNSTVLFNIEIKTSPLTPWESWPVEAYVDRLLEEIYLLGIDRRSLLQSFDWRALQRVQHLAPGIPTGYLSVQQPWFNSVEAARNCNSPWLAGLKKSHTIDLPEWVHQAGGSYWAPYFGDINGELIARTHAKGLRLAVWSVNREVDQQRMLDLGPNMIITDYPDRLRRLLQDRSIALATPTPIGSR